MKTVIIGGVAAGMSTAAKLKRELKDEHIVVYEKTDEVSYGACGLPYYVSGENDDLNKLRIRSVAQFEKAGIEVHINHEVIDVDFKKKQIKIKHGDEIFEDSYDRLVIASGAAAIVPPIEGANHDKVHVLKTLADGEALKKAADDAQ
ncbi:MAG: FAD-dependent oxidoreductase, partial [Erysipelothrix sp.]|nr:FAD-dependent oxidoreductase [Erysipelothrix sp.]